MTTVLRTDRLMLSPLTDGDTDALHAIFVDPGVRRFLWDGEIVPRSQTQEVIQQSRELFARHGYGLWTARLAADDAPIGFAGFWYFRDPPELELLYGLSSPNWSRGYATEMAARMIAYGFDTLSLSEIRASTDVPNNRSARVLEKCGMRLIDRRSVNGLDTVFYALAREDYSPPSRQLGV